MFNFSSAFNGPFAYSHQIPLACSCSAKMPNRTDSFSGTCNTSNYINNFVFFTTLHAMTKQKKLLFPNALKIWAHKHTHKNIVFICSLVFQPQIHSMPYHTSPFSIWFHFQEKNKHTCVCLASEKKRHPFLSCYRIFLFILFTAPIKFLVNSKFKHW